MAVPIAYGTLFGCFTWELGAFKAELYAFGVGAIADLAELVLSCHATICYRWAGAFLHFWAFLACDSANANLQIEPSLRLHQHYQI